MEEDASYVPRLRKRMVEGCPYTTLIMTKMQDVMVRSGY